MNPAGYVLVMIRTKNVLAKVVVGKISGLVIAGKKSVGSVNALKVTHNTEGEGSFHPRGVVNKVDDGRSKSINFIQAGLATSAAEVLVSKLSNPDGQVVEVVQLSGIGDEILSVSAVEVEGDGINLATRAGLEETSHPVKTSLVIGASRGDEVVALVLQRVDVLLPECGAILGAHVGLTRFVGLVHAKDVVSVTLDDQGLKVRNLVITPEHGDSLKAIEIVGQVRAPGVKESNIGTSCEVNEVVRIAVRPAQTPLASARRTTSGSWGCGRGWGDVGGGGGGT